jgi:hypothetical protein
MKDDGKKEVPSKVTKSSLATGFFFIRRVQNEIAWQMRLHLLVWI